mmetsp:Transcript_9823/g.17791  ORF Transcript_9823/g.17791 Transcript_9823/m.17791 type:complete len:580 (+) Transcript_9823:123-1862(+)
MRQLALLLLGISLRDFAYGLNDSTCSLELDSGKAPSPSVLQAKSTREAGAQPYKAKKVTKAASPTVLQSDAARQTGTQPYNSMQDAMESVASNWAKSGLGNSYVGTPNRFGPDDCIKLSSSQGGTCVITTNCNNADLSGVTFSFMCMNPGQVSTIHSFGQGGFAQQEVYDTEILCDSCVSVDRAFDTNSPLVQDTLKSMYYGTDGAVAAQGEGSREERGRKRRGRREGGEGASEDGEGSEGMEGGPEEGGSVQESASGLPDDDGTGMAGWKKESEGDDWDDKGKGHWAHENVHWDGSKWVTSDNSRADYSEFRETSYYGPSSCISTYKGWRGTCIIKTQCKGMDMGNVEVGVTCLEVDGSYKRYLFGRVFQPEEVFDTLTECVTCTGIGANPANQEQPISAIPKQLVDEINVLKHQIRDLKTTLVDYMGDDGELEGTSWIPPIQEASQEFREIIAQEDGTGNDGSGESVVTVAPPAPAPYVETAPPPPSTTRKAFSQSDFVSAWGDKAAIVVPEEELAPAPKLIAAPASGSHKFGFIAHSSSKLGSGAPSQAANLASAGSDRRPHELQDLLKELASDSD